MRRTLHSIAARCEATSPLFQSALWSSDFSRVDHAHLDAFVRGVMLAVGCKPRHAEAVARVLTIADLRGVYSHGVNRLEMYVADVQDGSTSTREEPCVLRETVATAHVDGRSCLGAVVGEFCMELAIAKAKQVGIGFVAARGSNHYGIAGHYALQAAAAGCIGLSMTNTSPLVAPTRGRTAMLGTNPIAVAAPAGAGARALCLDMATSAAPIGKVEVAARKGAAIPLGWAVDAAGRPSTDPAAVLAGGALLPLAGAEHSGGYKGYGLALAVELMAALLPGATYGPHVRPWLGANPGARRADLGQCFAAIDPAAFGDAADARAAFAERVGTFAGELRAAPAATGSARVLTHGEPEDHAAAEQAAHGIRVHYNLLAALDALAARLGLAPVPRREA